MQNPTARARRAKGADPQEGKAAGRTGSRRGELCVMQVAGHPGARPTGEQPVSSVLLKKITPAATWRMTVDGSGISEQASCKYPL